MGFGDSFFDMEQAYIKGIAKAKTDYQRPLWPKIAQRLFDMLIMMHKVCVDADWGSLARAEDLDMDKVKAYYRDQLLEHGAFTAEEVSWLE